MVENIKNSRKKQKVLNYKSCFDIIGPIMIGPSSSHTAGAVSIGQVARKLFGKTPKKIICKYYESFAETHKGHGTDYAIIAGILGFATNDSRVPQAIELAKSEGISIEFIEMEGDSSVHHANTACLYLEDDTHSIHVTGISLGGGTIEIKYIEIDGFIIEPQGTLPILLTLTKNENTKIGIENILKENNIKINKIVKLENDQDYLYEFDLDSRPLPAIANELVNFDKETRIILL